MTTSSPLPRPAPRLTDDPGVRFGIAVAFVVVGVLIDGTTHVGRVDTALSVIAIAGLTGAAMSGRRAGVLGLVAWAFYTGFVENSFGTLTLRPGDLARMGGFVAITLVIAFGLREALVAGARRDG